jgi:polyhydroxyalkanoate synthesis regulator phasin
VPPRQSSRSSSRSTSSQSKKKTTASRTRKPAAARATTTSPEPAGEGVREQLQRLLNPLELVVLTRERVQGALDEAVERGRLTRNDASDIATELLSRGRRQTDDLLGELEALVSRSRDQLGDARRRVSAPADRVVREVDRARRAAGIGPAFPISGYDDLTAAQVQARLGDLSAPELRKVRDYERRNANRKSVLGAIEQKLG